MTRINAVVRKEFHHILRDTRSLMIVFAMPVMMIVFYGYAISFDIKQIDAGVVDFSATEWSRDLARAFANNRYFRIHEPPPGGDPIAQAEKKLRSGEWKEYIYIPADFGDRLAAGRSAEVGLVVDGSDSNTANLVYQYSQQIVMQYMLSMKNLEELIQIRTHFYFNPEAKSYIFFIPGLIAILLLMVSALLTSISITREKESGSIDLLFISPLKSREIILGKTVPYIFVALIAGVFILLFARFWFHIPFRGNLLVLLFFSLIYIFCGLAFGILVSTLASSQRMAMLGALLATLLPSIMLSGFIFPIDSMPVILQFFARLVPATYFLRIIRGVVVKGAELNHFLIDGGILLGMSLVLILAATGRFVRLRRGVR